MSVHDAVAKIVSFLRVGCPAGRPTAGAISVLALLPRRLTDAEVVQIAARLGQRTRPVDVTSIRVMITKFTDRLPAPDEVARVTQYLRLRGVAVDDEFPHPTGH